MGSKAQRQKTAAMKGQADVGVDKQILESG